MKKINLNQRLWIGDFNGHIFEFDLTKNQAPLTVPTLNIGVQINFFDRWINTIVDYS